MVLFITLALLGLVLFFIFFFIPDVSKDEQAFNEQWSAAADHLGLEFFPHDGDFTRVRIEGIHEGTPLLVAPEFRTRRKDLSPLASAAIFLFVERHRRRLWQNEQIPFTRFTLNLNPMAKEAMELYDRNQNFPSHARPFQSQIPIVDQRFGFRVSKNHPGLSELIASPQITSILAQAQGLFPKLQINSGVLVAEIEPPIIETAPLLKRIEILHQLVAEINQAAVDTSPFDDPRYPKSNVRHAEATDQEAQIW